MVKEEWSVVQCTNCEKVNKIPGTDDVNKQIRLNDNLNHFDIHLPYVVCNQLDFNKLVCDYNLSVLQD